MCVLQEYTSYTHILMFSTKYNMFVYMCAVCLSVFVNVFSVFVSVCVFECSEARWHHKENKILLNIVKINNNMV